MATGRFKRLLFVTRSSNVASIIVVLLIVSLPTWAQRPLTPNENTRERGIRLYESGDIGAAITALRQAVNQDKMDGIAWYHLGLALYRSNKYKDARKALETAAKLRPDDAAVHTLLAFTLVQNNKNDEARREAKLAIALNEKNAGAHYVLGVVNMRNGEFGEARMSADNALRIEPNMPLALLLKSQALISMLSYASLNPDKKPFPDNGLDNSDYLLLKEAAELLERYLQLSHDDANEWQEQLDTLRFYANFAIDEQSRGKSEVFKPRDVTMKARILSKPSPDYPADARQAGVTGTVVLQMVLASDGKVKHILVLRWLGHGLVNQAVKAARRIKFVPATKDGLPVSQFIRVEYNFNIF